MNREILLVKGRRPYPELQSALVRSGWTVRAVADVAEAKGSGIDASHALGLAIVDPPEAWSPDSLEALTATGPADWIAVIAREALQDPVLCKTILDGFYDFHTFPLDVDRLLVVLGHASGRINLASQLRRPAATRNMFGMVGRSHNMLEHFRDIEKVARYDAPVLISGESGTGKELTARAIHRLSSRSRGPFIAVNCGALPVHLVHSELFGHERGAFTGAHQRKMGSIQAAQGGVVLLDEIEDLPLELQSSLLRFLQERTIVRLGSTEVIRIDARVIAATNVDLWELVRRKRFREDLYYRLHVLHLHIPPLRDRPGDVRLLAEDFFERAGAQRNPHVAGFSRQAMAAMEAYSWPGNVRELMNCVQQALIMCEKRLIMPSDLDIGSRVAHSTATSLRQVRGRTDHDVIYQALLASRANVAATARRLGVSRTTLYRLLRKFQIDVRAPPPPGEAVPEDQVSS